MIDTQVRMSAAREAGEVYRATRDSHDERESSRADRRWYRGELIAMLAAAKTERDLQGLGLSDDVVREARLADSLMDAWTRFRPAHFAPPRRPDCALTGAGECAHRPAPLFFDQRLIDHEVRLSKARETAETYVTRRAVRRERTSIQADWRWYRRELIGMLEAARTEDDVRELGLSDEVVREAGLADSLMEAWTRFRPPHFAPSLP